MTKQKVRENVIRIFKMSKEEVENYRRKISTSNADMKAKRLLYEACDVRIQNTDTTNAIAVNGDLDDFN